MRMLGGPQINTLLGHGLSVGGLKTIKKKGGKNSILSVVLHKVDTF